MALRVWLPLTGTLENKGISNVTVTNNGATINVNGKIGSCYAFNGNNYYISLVGQQLFDCFKGEAQPFSICMWVYHADSRRAILFGDWSLSNSIGFNIELYTGHGVRFYWSGSPDYNTTLNVGASTWNHIAITYDGTKLRSYLNGLLTATRDGVLAARSKTAGEFRLGRDSRTTDTALNGYLNDVRIYDHCLSAAEVKEISQGLVLHYKLDSFQGGYGNPNVIVTHSNAGVDGTGTSGWSAAGTGWSNSFVSATGATGGYAIRCTYANTSQTSGGIHHSTGVDKTTLTTGDIYTLSARIRTSKACVVTFQNELMTTGHTINATTDWQVYTYTCAIDTSKTYQSNVMYVRAADAAQNMWIECDWIKLEKGTAATPWQPSGVIGTAIQDSSGYGHNGTLNNIKLINNSARYSSSINFPENNSTVTIPSIYTNGQTLTEITVNCWFRTNTLNSTAPNIFSLGENAFLRSRLASSTSIWSYYRVISTQKGVAYSCKTVTDNAWHMLTFVFNNGTEITYIDGSQIGTTNQSGTGTYLTCASTSWHLAGYTANSENFLGNLSDFRIYCTALSADDILTLYHTAAKVDNLQSLHSRELIEGQPTIKVTKQGQLKEGEIQETTATKFYKTSQVVATKQAIEF